MREVAGLIAKVLENTQDQAAIAAVRKQVAVLTERFPPTPGGASTHSGPSSAHCDRCAAVGVFWHRYLHSESGQNRCRGSMRPIATRWSRFRERNRFRGWVQTSRQRRSPVRTPILSRTLLFRFLLKNSGKWRSGWDRCPDGAASSPRPSVRSGDGGGGDPRQHSTR